MIASKAERLRLQARAQRRRNLEKFVRESAGAFRTTVIRYGDRHLLIAAALAGQNSAIVALRLIALWLAHGANMCMRCTATMAVEPAAFVVAIPENPIASTGMIAALCDACAALPALDLIAGAVRSEFPDARAVDPAAEFSDSGGRR